MWKIMPYIAWHEKKINLSLFHKLPIIPQSSNIGIKNPYWQVIYKLATTLYDTGIVPADILEQVPQTAKWLKAETSNNINLTTESYFWLSMTSVLIELRDYYVNIYGWSIPFPMTIEAIAEVCGGKIVEMGAGKGYWANILHQYGIDIIAYDIDFQHDVKYHQVLPGNPLNLNDHPDRTLLLVWPPFRTPMAMECLQNYKGDMVIYVGEFEGCTGNQDFHDTLTKEWDEVANIPNANWNGIYDSALIYKRKPALIC